MFYRHARLDQCESEMTHVVLGDHFHLFGSSPILFHRSRGPEAIAPILRSLPMRVQVDLFLQVAVPHWDAEQQLQLPKGNGSRPQLPSAKMQRHTPPEQLDQLPLRGPDRVIVVGPARLPRAMNCRGRLNGYVNQLLFPGVALGRLANSLPHPLDAFRVLETRKERFTFVDPNPSRQLAPGARAFDPLIAEFTQGFACSDI